MCIYFMYILSAIVVMYILHTMVKKTTSIAIVFACVSVTWMGTEGTNIHFT